MIFPKGAGCCSAGWCRRFSGFKTGGTLYLAGANDLGIQAAVKDVQQLFGQGAILGYKKGNRVLRCIKRTSQLPVVDWTNEAGIRQDSWIEHRLQFPALAPNEDQAARRRYTG